MSASPIRCAIYTRKSSEEGLDQAFNSLDAQREACEAYVLSQAGEGWTTLPAHYDDGGYSGGNIERPALQRLLADIDAGKVDIVVVYKIDRLTRSLGDFSKIVERLDGANASFVSVTQAFNTTTSMGRLTLNVLLSFAQFEREVTGERIRDKIAASKKKGMWMGGRLPLGYDAPTDPVTRALVVNEAEAETVRLIFTTYLDLKSVSALRVWLNERAIRSKVTVSRAGTPVGGQPFARGALFHLLRNRTYLGEIPHGDISYPAPHAAIVPVDVFEAVQTLLNQQCIVHRGRPLRSAEARLKGRIFDAEGHAMSPAFTHGDRGQIYRYYVSAPLQRGEVLAESDSAIRRVPGPAVDEFVLAALTRLTDKVEDAAIKLLARAEVHGQSLRLSLSACELTKAGPTEALKLIQGRLDPGETAHLAAGQIHVSLPIRLQIRGGRTWLLGPSGKPALTRPKTDKVLIKALKAAHALARKHGLSGGVAPVDIQAPPNAYDRKLCRIAFLAPDIQEAIVEGRQPPGLTLERLVQDGVAPSWADQRAAFGF